MRATTAFNKMLAIDGATVTQVIFTPEGIVVGIRRRSKSLTCPCGHKGRATYDSSVRRWRHLDLGACRLFIQCRIESLECPKCKGVRTEQVQNQRRDVKPMPSVRFLTRRNRLHRCLAASSGRRSR